MKISTLRQEIYVPTTEEILGIHDYFANNNQCRPGLISDPSYVSNACESYLKQEGLVPTLAFLLSRLSKGHYFVDGNKRTAYLTARFAALMNGADFDGSSPKETVVEMGRIAALPDERSQLVARKLLERDLLFNGDCITGFDAFERLVLKSAVVSSELRDA